MMRLLLRSVAWLLAAGLALVSFARLAWMILEMRSDTAGQLSFDARYSLIEGLMDLGVFLFPNSTTYFAGPGVLVSAITVAVNALIIGVLVWAVRKSAVVLGAVLAMYAGLCIAGFLFLSTMFRWLLESL